MRVKETLTWDHLKDKLAADKLASTSEDGVKGPRIEPDSQGRIYATGKRKTSIARVWLKPGSGRMMINDRMQDTYFQRETLRMLASQPLQLTSRIDQYDVWATVVGGGLSSQANAVRHGLSKALQIYEPGLRATLKTSGFLTRDSRIVERKKPGFRKARRKPQFSKR